MNIVILGSVINARTRASRGETPACGFTVPWCSWERIVNNSLSALISCSVLMLPKPAGVSLLKLFSMVLIHFSWTAHEIKPHLSNAMPRRCQHHSSFSSDPVSPCTSDVVWATLRTAFSIWMELVRSLMATWISSSRLEHLEGAIQMMDPVSKIWFARSTKWWLGSNSPVMFKPAKRPACSSALARFSATGSFFTVTCWSEVSFATDCFRLAMTRVVASKYKRFKFANWPIVGAPP